MKTNEKKKRKKKTINQNRSKHSKAGLIAFIENNFKYILAAIAVIIAIIAVFFGESKLIYQQEPVTAHVKFSVINYEITPEVEQGQTPVVEYAYTLAQAVSKAPAGKSTIKVLVGVEETVGVTIPENKEIELDLNGKTTTLDGVSISNYGTLTVTDSTTTENNPVGTGKITSTNSSIITVEDGEVEINAGTIENTGNTPNLNTIVNGRDGTLTISNGRINSTFRCISSIGILNITGGEFTAEGVDGDSWCILSLYTKSGTVNISGGTFNSKVGTATEISGYSSSGTARAIQVDGVADVTLTGGTFTGDTIGIILEKGGTLTLGTDDTSVSINKPEIIGKSYRGIQNSGCTFNFYDGIVKGPTGQSIIGTVTAKPSTHSVIYGTEIIDGTTYETATLQKSIPDTIINTESMYVPGAQVRVDGVHNYSNSGTEGKNYEATTWADISGSGNNGAITSNTLKWGENYLEFDGSSTWVNLGEKNSDYQTLEATFYIKEIKSGIRSIITNTQGGGGSIYITGNTIRAIYRIQNNGTDLDYAKAERTNILEAGKIYHVSSTYDGNVVKLYLNGEEIARSEIKAGTIKNPDLNTIMVLGAEPRGSAIEGSYFDGKIFSAAVYNRALTADEVVQNATASLAMAGGTVSTDNLTYTIRFPNAVTGFTSDDITLTNGTKGTFTEVTAGQAYTLNAALSTDSTTTSAVTQRITVPQAAATVTSTSTPTSEASRTVAIAPAYQNTKTNKCYITLKEAFDEVQTNQTIKAINSTIDRSSATPTITAGKTVTFDSNGKTVVLDKKISNNGILNVESSTGNGIIYSTASECIDNLNANSQVIVNSGKIEATGTAILNTSSTKNTTASPAITITGGEISSTGSYAIASSLSSSMIYIKEVTGQTPPVIWSTGAAAIRAVGSFTMECGTVYGYSGSAVCVYRTSLITGGELIKAKNPVTNAWVGDACFDNRGNYNATIKGNAVIKNENGNSSNVVYNYGSGTLEISENAQVRNLGAVRTGTNAGKGKILVKDNAIVSSAGEDIFSNAYASSTSDNYGTIEVQGGTLSTTGNTVIRSSSNYGRIIVSGGTLEATGSSGSYGTIHNAADYVKIDISGGTITHPNIPIYNAGGADNSEIKITGGTVETTTSTNSIYNNGTGTTIIIGTTNAASNDSPVIKGRIWGYNSDCGLITVNSGTITAKTGEAIYSLGNITVNGGIITGKNQAIIGADASGPTITVTGGKLTNELHNTGAITNSAGTTIISGTAEIEGGTKGVYATTGDIIVTGGKIVSTLGEGVYVQTGNITIGDKDDATVANNNSPVIVGKLHGVKKSDSTSGDLKFYDGIVYGPDVTHAIWGDVTDRPSGYDIVNGSAKYDEQEYTFATLAIPTKNYLLHDGGTGINTYDTLSQAINAIPANANKSYRIVALNNTTEPATTQAKGTESNPVTLDLNGKTITMTGTLTNSGYLTIDGTGTLTTSAAINLITNAGTLNIPSTGTISNTNTGAYRTINNTGTVNKTGTGTISSATTDSTIYGGTINVSAGTVSVSNAKHAIETATGSVSITGGTISSTAASAINIYGSGTLTINESSGNTTRIEKSGSIVGSTVQVSGSAIANITAGTIETVTGGSGAINNQSSGKVTIDGATIKQSGTGVAIVKSGTGDLEIKSGTVTACRNTIMNKNTTGSITISGGEIKNTEAYTVVVNDVAGTINIGTDDATVSTTSPKITATNSSGKGVNVGTGTLNFYDGVITGSTNNSITGTGTVNTPTGYTVRKSTANNVETAVLSNQYNVQFLSGNLLEGVTLENHGITNPAGPINGVYTGTLTTATSGWKIPASNFTVGKTYSLRFKVQKTAGILKNITGAAQAATAPQKSFIIDGKNSTCEYSISITQSTIPSNITDDTNEHVVEFKFQYLGNGTDKNIYIQPNRGYTTSVTVNLYDVELYEVVQESSKTYGSTYGTMPTVSRTGYTLAGWNTNDNLITTDKNEWEQGGIIDADGTISTNDSIAPRRLRLKEYQVIESNATYTLTTDSSSDIRIRYVYFYDANKTFISKPGNTSTVDVVQFTTPSNCKYFKVVLQKTHPDTDTITLDELSSANLTLSGTVSSTMLVPNNDVDVYAQWMGPVLLYYAYEPYLKEGTSDKIILCIKVETDTSKYTIVKTGFVYYTGEGEPSKELTIENVDSELGIKIVGKAQETYSPTLTDSGNGAYIRAYTIIKDNVTQIEAVKYLDTRYVSAAELTKKTLTYDANGHGTAPANVTMTYADATNAAAALTATGYTFTGWNTAADGTGTAYAAGAEVKAANTLPTEMTLYAQWMLDGVNLGNGVVVNKDNVKNYLGKAVSYTDNDANTNLTYRLFYVDFDNKYGDGAGTVYLMADYDESLKRSRLGTNYDSSNSTDSTMKINQMNPLWAETRGLSSVTWETNEKAAAYLCDTTLWTKYKNNDANYAIGGASTEMYIDSYNLSGIDTEVLGYANAGIGYVYTVDGVQQNVLGETNSNTLETNKMYTNNDSGNWWLASPQRGDTTYMSGVWCSSRSLSYYPYIYRYGTIVVRPLVSLKSGITVTFTE